MELRAIERTTSIAAKRPMTTPALRCSVPRYYINKTENVPIKKQWGAFVKPLLPRKRNKYSVFWLYLFSCLSYPACNRIVSASYYFVISGLSRCTVFLVIISQSHDFWGGGGHLLNLKRLFWFSLHLLSETFRVLWRIQRDINSQNLHVK
jgi:hypothetical protein